MKVFPGSLADHLQKAEVYDEFCALMFDKGDRYEDLLEQLEKWGVSSSNAALSRFWDSQRSSWTILRAKRLAEETMQMEPDSLDLAQRQLIAERLFAMAASPHVSEKALLKIRELEIKSEQLKNDSRRITILEGKLKAASEKLDELRDPEKANDADERMRILDAVDDAMGIKKKS